MTGHYIVESVSGRYWNTKTERYIGDLTAYQLGLRNARTRKAWASYIAACRGKGKAQN